ncbi:MAG: ferrous iron transport protein A [Fidelibacterota bacterium]
MSSTQSLTHVPTGSLVTVRGFSDQSRLISRLVEMGIIPGINLRVIKTAPFQGPVEIKVRDYYVSIRHEDASQILVAAVHE